jgi:hypothetical protein
LSIGSGSLKTAQAFARVQPVVLPIHRQLGKPVVAGSVNFKDKYAPDFPRVAIAHFALARIAVIRIANFYFN